jgi:hypothetical protein
MAPKAECIPPPQKRAVADEAGLVTPGHRCMGYISNPRIPSRERDTCDRARRFCSRAISPRGKV